MTDVRARLTEALIDALFQVCGEGTYECAYWSLAEQGIAHVADVLLTLPETAQHGRELAAQAIEAEARAMEEQFGICNSDPNSLTSRAAAASGALWEAARIARGANDENQQPTQKETDMTISADTINLCLELLSGVSVPVTAPDAEVKMRSLVAARHELLAALPDMASPSI